MTMLTNSCPKFGQSVLTKDLALDDWNIFELLKDYPQIKLKEHSNDAVGAVVNDLQNTKEILSKSINWNHFFKQSLITMSDLLRSMTYQYNEENKNHLKLQLAYDQRTREWGQQQEQLICMLHEIQPLRERVKISEELAVKEQQNRIRHEAIEKSLYVTIDQMTAKISFLHSKVNPCFIKSIEKKLQEAKQLCKRLKVDLHDASLEIANFRTYISSHHVHLENTTKKLFWSLSMARKAIKKKSKMSLIEINAVDAAFNDVQSNLKTRYNTFKKEQERKLAGHKLELTLISKFDSWLNIYLESSTEEKEISLKSIDESEVNKLERLLTEMSPQKFEINNVSNITKKIKPEPKNVTRRRRSHKENEEIAVTTPISHLPSPNDRKKSLKLISKLKVPVVKVPKILPKKKSIPLRNNRKKNIKKIGLEFSDSSESELEENLKNKSLLPIAGSIESQKDRVPSVKMYEDDYCNKKIVHSLPIDSKIQCDISPAIPYSNQHQLDLNVIRNIVKELSFSPLGNHQWPSDISDSEDENLNISRIVRMNSTGFQVQTSQSEDDVTKKEANISPKAHLLRNGTAATDEDCFSSIRHNEKIVEPCMQSNRLTKIKSPKDEFFCLSTALCSPPNFSNLELNCEYKNLVTSCSSSNTGPEVKPNFLKRNYTLLKNENNFEQLGFNKQCVNKLTNKESDDDIKSDMKCRYKIKGKLLTKPNNIVNSNKVVTRQQAYINSEKKQPAIEKTESFDDGICIRKTRSSDLAKMKCSTLTDLKEKIICAKIEPGSHTLYPKRQLRSSINTPDAKIKVSPEDQNDVDTVDTEKMNISLIEHLKTEGDVDNDITKVHTNENQFKTSGTVSEIKYSKQEKNLSTGEQNLFHDSTSYVKSLFIDEIILTAHGDDHLSISNHCTSTPRKSSLILKKTLNSVSVEERSFFNDMNISSDAEKEVASTLADMASFSSPHKKFKAHHNSVPANLHSLSTVPSTQNDSVMNFYCGGSKAQSIDKSCEENVTNNSLPDQNQHNFQPTVNAPAASILKVKDKSLKNDTLSSSISNLLSLDDFDSCAWKKSMKNLKSEIMSHDQPCITSKLQPLVRCIIINILSIEVLSEENGKLILRPEKIQCLLEISKQLNRSSVLTASMPKYFIDNLINSAIHQLIVTKNLCPWSLASITCWFFSSIRRQNVSDCEDDNRRIIDCSQAFLIDIMMLHKGVCHMALFVAAKINRFNFSGNRNIKPQSSWRQVMLWIVHHGSWVGSDSIRLKLIQILKSSFNVILIPSKDVALVFQSLLKDRLECDTKNRLCLDSLVMLLLRWSSVESLVPLIKQDQSQFENSSPNSLKDLFENISNKNNWLSKEKWELIRKIYV